MTALLALGFVSRLLSVFGCMVLAAAAVDEHLGCFEEVGVAIVAAVAGFAVAAAAVA